MDVTDKNWEKMENIEGDFFGVQTLFSNNREFQSKSSDDIDI